MDKSVDVYFSADIETDGAIPGYNSMLSFALVLAGTFDGSKFERPKDYKISLYKELKPISEEYDQAALEVNGFDRSKLIENGQKPEVAMLEAYDWVQAVSGKGSPVFVAYPLSFDWSWMFWYFSRFCPKGSPFGHSRCFDIKTALSVKLGRSVSNSGRSNLPWRLQSSLSHSHNALDDAIEQAEIFANIFEWRSS
ncbi:hypothetical protein [Rhodobacter lacus]|uniref:Exonuclease n=1 Tax=Rhodobacter lacus TaxID=1641972 RepID=A0ABW5A7H1_9RHOB